MLRPSPPIEAGQKGKAPGEAGAFHNNRDTRAALGLAGLSAFLASRWNLPNNAGDRVWVPALSCGRRHRHPDAMVGHRGAAAASRGWAGPPPRSRPQAGRNRSPPQPRPLMPATVQKTQCLAGFSPTIVRHNVPVPTLWGWVGGWVKWHARSAGDRQDRQGKEGEGVLRRRRWPLSAGVRHRSKSWVFRFRLGGKPARDMGLGGFPATTHSDARQKAHEARRPRPGEDPIAARDAAAAQKQLAEARGTTFRECAKQPTAIRWAGAMPGIGSSGQTRLRPTPIPSWAICPWRPSIRPSCSK